MDPSALRDIAGQPCEASLRKMEGDPGLDSVTVSYVIVRLQVASGLSAWPTTALPKVKILE
jgi:hypothetical protein